MSVKDVLDWMSLIDSTINLIWKLLSISIFISLILIQYSYSSLAINTSITILIISFSAIIFLVPELYKSLASEEESPKANSSMVVNHAKIKTEIGRSYRSHTRKLTIKALEPIDHAIHKTRASAPVDINFSIREGGSLRGPTDLAGSEKVIVDFPREIKEGNTHTYILHYDVKDPEGELKTYHTQRFSSFLDCEIFVWEIVFDDIPDTVERYVRDKEGVSVVNQFGNIPLDKNGRDIFKPAEVDAEVEYVYEWRW